MTTPNLSLPLHVRLLKVGDHFADARGQVYRKIGVSIPAPNSRLGREHMAVSVVTSSLRWFAAQTWVRKLELPA